MTGLAAQRLRLKDRGLLKEGFIADVTVFDPRTVLDRATIARPHRFARGIRHVLVNGIPVIRNGRPTWKLPGRPVLGPGHP
jgi:N-acyl-D-amino-acid deacylase